MKSYKTVDQYINQFPDDKVIAILKKMRITIRSAAPKATEVISYGIPTFKLNGKNLVHFGAFKDHFSFFPTSSPIPVFRKELTKYKLARGTIQFPLGAKIPYDLITKITKFRVNQVIKQNGK